MTHTHSIYRAFISNYIIFIKDNQKNWPISIEEFNIIKDITLPIITGKAKKRIPQVISKLEVYALESAMSSERNKLMTLITFYAGLRLSGLLSIKPYDFQWKKWSLDNTKPLELRVIEKGDKERIVFIPSDIAIRLKEWIINFASKKNKSRDVPIFKMSKRYWRRLINEASVKALGYQIHPHTLRHSAATNLLDNGWDIKEIQEYLGHESISSTEIYLHINKTKLKKKFESI